MSVTDRDKIETLQKLVAEYKERAIEVVRAEIASGAQGAVAPWLWACTGCGSQMTMDQIKGEHLNALCCCPERRMAPLPSTDRRCGLCDGPLPCLTHSQFPSTHCGGSDV